MENIWFQALAKKVRFSTTKGELTTEQLLGLSVTQSNLEFLDGIYADLHKIVKESGSVSLIQKSKSADDVLELKFALIKEIIEQKLKISDEAEAKKKAKEWNEKIDSLIAAKQEENLKNLPLEELLKLKK